MHGVTTHLGMDIEGKGQSHNIAYVKDAIPTTGVGVLIYAMFWDWPFPSMPVSMWMISGNIMMPKGHRYGPSMSMDLVASNNLLCYMLQWQLPAKCSSDDLNQVCSRDTFCGMLQQNGQQLRFFRMHRKQFFSACDICHMFCKAEFLLLQIAANIALVKNWTIHGIFWGAHQQAQPRVFRRTLEESVQWLSEGKVRVPVSHK